ncbi:LysR family transcriptional regulator [Yersinia mollaretii]|uniref:LysR family transcriptional regulator n=1 Tax=Yersinia mollaretii TaxID=33060 RepID=UPI00119EDF43|nr:LysR family transcriptional regulator [Yersinia mollaretii]
MALPSPEKFDYNLIRFLVAIVETNSMASAAEILDVAPSAVSYAVKKLREHYKDPLFIRSLHGVKPTAFALNLYARFKLIHDNILKSLDIESEAIRPERKIYIRADALTELWVTDRLLKSGIVPEECTVEFKYSVINAEDRSHRLRTQEIDLDIGLIIPGDRNIISYSLFDWEYMLICRKNHETVGDHITKIQFAIEPFTAHFSRFNSTILLNNFNELRHLRPKEPDIMSESSVTMILSILNHDLLMFIPRIYFSLLKKTLPIKEVKCDFIPEGKISNLIHLNKKQENDELLNKIISILKQDH